MKRVVFGFLLLILPLGIFAAPTDKLCNQIWFHLAGMSKHVEVYEPNEYTRYKRQTHPGLGVECQNEQYTLALGKFVNSLDRPFQYATAATDILSLADIKLFVGLLAGEYGRTVREPLKIISPIAYVEYTYKYAGINFFVLPPARGYNDYAIFFTQFKLGF